MSSFVGREVDSYVRSFEIDVDGVYLDYFMRKHHLDEQMARTRFSQLCHKELVGFYDDDELPQVLMVPVTSEAYVALQELELPGLASELNTHEHALEAVQALIAGALADAGGMGEHTTEHSLDASRAGQV